MGYNIITVTAQKPLAVFDIVLLKEEQIMVEHKQNESQVHKKKSWTQAESTKEELSVQTSGDIISQCIKSSGSFVSK